MSDSFVLEFIIDSIKCKNLNAMNSPLHITFPKVPPIILEPKNVTLTKISYQKGKRLIFKHDNLLDLNAQFLLRSGHGNLAVRGKCTIDFFEVCQHVGENAPVYQVDIAMNRPDGSRLGVMSFSFQIFPYQEYVFSVDNQKAIIKEQQNKANKKIIRPIKSARSQRRSSDCGSAGANKRVTKSSAQAPKNEGPVRKNPRRYNTNNNM
ncbi:hypothetical protein TRFO_22472 [Tritrichomonas foetus]|uniref:Uncharacterized protein n=1 Tax=Tritrichomonas foetus TaxID=1144522 RepID=A0A1J4KCE6_9EUKA|nr:hypothetical protein TRFO_22472 [Tritrichomonas foetus]|eukprot:OHT08883.1 hypothetical protein TRFO_22472 [Tritrichomonas foetus]